MGDGVGAAGFREQLAEIEELRNLSIALARERLQALLVELLQQANSVAMVSRQLLGQLALGTGVWAGLSWLERQFSASCDAYCLAFELAAVDTSPELLIQLKQRAAHLVADSGFMDYAKVWLREAVDFYACSGKSEGQGKALVDLGRITFLSGELQAATGLFEKALPLLPRENFRYRVAALEALSNCYQDSQDLNKASLTLEQAFTEYGDRRDSYRGYLAWVRARLSGQSEAEAEAEGHYSEAVELLHRFGGTLAAELALLDFSDFRVRNGKGTKDIGQLVMDWLKESRYDAKAAQVAAKMVSALLWGTPTPDDIAHLRRILEQTGGVTCPPRLKLG